MTLPKMYALTCPQFPWRRDRAEQHFRELGLEVEFWQGVHGPTVGILPRLPTFDVPRDSHLISAGQLGITLSMVLMWSVLLERPDDRVLIFEDDVVLCPDFKGLLRQALSDLPGDWDVVSVGSCCATDKPRRHVKGRVWELWVSPMCNHALLWTKPGMARALEAFRKSSWGTPSDVILQQVVYPRLRHYTLLPGLAEQRVQQSDAGTVTDWENVQGWFDFRSVYDAALDRVRQTSLPATFVEVGSWLGRSTIYLAEEIKRRLLPVKLTCVDTWQGTVGDDDLMRELDRLGGADALYTAWRNNVSRAGVHDYVTALRMPSTQAAATFEDGSLDFVFLDADHSYEAVKADVAAWLPKVKAGGVLAGHDWNFEGVRQAVTEAFGPDGVTLCGAQEWPSWWREVTNAT